MLNQNPYQNKDELNLMYLNIGPGTNDYPGGIGGFSSRRYWSSTEIFGSGMNAWCQYFNDNGDQTFYAKDAMLSVRPVRAF